MINYNHLLFLSSRLFFLFVFRNEQKKKWPLRCDRARTNVIRSMYTVCARAHDCRRKKGCSVYLGKKKHFSGWRLSWFSQRFKWKYIFLHAACNFIDEWTFEYTYPRHHHHHHHRALNIVIIIILFSSKNSPLLGLLNTNIKFLDWNLSPDDLKTFCPLWVN